MSEFKGTKGKWDIRPTQALNENGKPLFYDIVIGGSSFISTHRNEYINIGDEQQLANAKLISCAPEMLEMLNKIIIFITKNKDKNYMIKLLEREVSELEQLIKKATE